MEVMLKRSELVQVSRACAANVLSRSSLERCYQWREASTAGRWAMVRVVSCL
jgi:hypothetical protein